jgi:hypothetical protein
MLKAYKKYCFKNQERSLKAAILKCDLYRERGAQEGRRRRRRNLEKMKMKMKTITHTPTHTLSHTYTHKHIQNTFKD